MASKMRGEAAIGDRTLVFDANAFCDLEDRLGMGIGKIIATLQADPSVSFLRTLVWAGLQNKHEGISERSAGDIISALGLDASLEAIGEAFASALPDAEGDETENPTETVTLEPTG